MVKGKHLKKIHCLKSILRRYVFLSCRTDTRLCYFGQAVRLYYRPLRLADSPDVPLWHEVHLHKHFVALMENSGTSSQQVMSTKSNISLI